MMHLGPTRIHRPVLTAVLAAVLAVVLAVLATGTASSAPAPSQTDPVAATGSDPISATGTVSATAAPTFEQFLATTFRDHDGAWIVNGDEPLRSLGQLRHHYDRMLGAPGSPLPPAGVPAKGPVASTPGPGLVVNQTPSGDDRWSSRSARNLTYCVSNAFGGSKATVVSAMAAAAAVWERQSSGVDFTHLPAADAACRTTNDRVLFSVEPTSTTRYTARAFFPSSTDRERNVLVNASLLTRSGSTPAAVMAHELGHVLGFRHEHTRPEAGTCFEDTNWRPLTPYDSASIMHYPQCGGSASSLSFSVRDGEGLRALYGR